MKQMTWNEFVAFMFTQGFDGGIDDNPVLWNNIAILLDEESLEEDKKEAEERAKEWENRGLEILEAVKVMSTRRKGILRKMLEDN